MTRDEVINALSQVPARLGLEGVCALGALALVVSRGDWPSVVALGVSLCALVATKWRVGDPSVREELRVLKERVARIGNRGPV